MEKGYTNARVLAVSAKWKIERTVHWVGVVIATNQRLFVAQVQCFDRPTVAMEGFCELLTALKINADTVEFQRNPAVQRSYVETTKVQHKEIERLRYRITGIAFTEYFSEALLALCEKQEPKIVYFCSAGDGGYLPQPTTPLPPLK